MNLSTVLSLAAVLFKSYFRASRPGYRSPFSNPRVVILVDVVLFTASFGLISYLLPSLPSDLTILLQPVVAQAIVGLPVILTSAVILAGILFELGQTSGLASSEAVNWLPVTPQEYVIGSSVSVCFAYSLFPALAFGLTIPLALRFGMSSVIPFFVLISLLSFLWGAVIVETLRAVMNRISTSVYKRSGRFGVVLRLALLVTLLVAVQIAFNPYILYAVLSSIVSGINLAWFVPMVWPSVVVLSLLLSDNTRAAVFVLLSAVFTFLILESAAWLRVRYWSPMAVTISVSTSTVYTPKERSFLWLDSVSFSLASKELKSLSRRKDMARFLAIPIMLVIVTILPIITSGEDSQTALSGVSLLLLSEASIILPIMLSSVSIGQEGRSITNIYMLPISAEELIKGKLFHAWIISGVAVFGIAVLMQILAPVSPLQFLVTLVAIAFIVVTEGYIGLGAGSRHPDFTIGPRARYVTFTGFIIAFALGLAVTATTLLPLILYFTGFFTILIGGSISILLTIMSTIVVGMALLILARSYCKRGVEKFLSNMEV
ncbi:MAG: hypothetical protein QG670_1801 [Thermoproteota archaeon]|nr:hypothetical protein [Thermoproteota archaeon]